MELNFKPRLTKGRHLHTVDEHGPMCLIEAVGFNEDGRVDDQHASIDPVLAALGRVLNDRMCNHFEHPLAEATGDLSPDRVSICDGCQARLWGVGERIAQTGYQTPDWSAAELAEVHVGLALEAAGAVLRLIDTTDPLYQLAHDAIEAGAFCSADADETSRAAARLAASRIENHTQRENSSSSWAGFAAANAVRAAASVAGNTISDTSTTYFFAERRCIETITFALGATAGNPPASMRVARRVLNAFGKATSRKVTPGESPEDIAKAAADTMRAQLRVEDEERAAARRARNRTNYCAEPEAVEMPLAVADAAAFHLEAAAAGVWGGDAIDRAMGEAIAEADAAWEEADGPQPAPPGTCYACHQESVMDICADCAGAGAHVAGPGLTEDTEEYEEVDDFAESIVGDVADEAIGDLQRAESMLLAIGVQHRAVESWTRRTVDGFSGNVEYRTKCCVSCRDIHGQPVAAPCPTMRIIDGYDGV